MKRVEGVKKDRMKIRERMRRRKNIEVEISRKRLTREKIERMKENKGKRNSDKNSLG